MSTRLGLAAALLLVAALGVGGALWWFESAGAAAGEVRVAWADGSPRCTGTTVRPAAHPVVVARPGMRCTVTVVVRNAGGRGALLGQVRFGLVGPDTGGVVLATRVAGRAPHPDREDSDAWVDLDRSLAPGARTSFDVVLVFHPEGCDQDAVVSTRPWPRVEVTSWRRTVWRAGDETFRFSHAGRTPGCPRH